MMAASTDLSVTVGSALEFDRRNAPSSLVDRLLTSVSVANPTYDAALKRGGRVPYGTPTRLRGVTVHDDAVRVPRGALRELHAAATACGLRLSFDDRRMLPAERLETVTSPSLRDYQARAVDALCERQQGVFVFPCGAGKTRAALGVIARLRTPTLVLVSSLDLAAQWRKELGTIGVSAGLIGGGDRDVKSVTIALVPSLVRLEQADLDVFLSGFGLLIIDEAHHVPSDTFANIVDRCPAKYRLALTATPHREDGLGPMLGWYCGEVIAKVTHAELIASGALIAPEIRTLDTEFTHPYFGPSDYAPMLDALAEDPARNRLIVDVVTGEVRAGHVVLVLTGRVDHCTLLAEALAANGVTASAMTGKVSKRCRAEILQSAREGNTKVVIATSLADEGLDLPRLSRVVLAFPARAQGRTEQRLGRIMRPHPDKPDAALIDIVDVHVGVLRHQHRQRLATFRRVLGGTCLTGVAG